MKIIGKTISKNNIEIRLTEEQWVHIVESHDYMSGNYELVLESVNEPDFLIKGWTDEVIALKHYDKTCISEKYVVVVYKEKEENFIITALMTSNLDKFLRRGIIWQKGK